MEMNLMTIALAALGAAGIGFTWYLKVRPQGEPLNPYKLLQSAIFGAVAGVLLAVTGVAITDTTVINMIEQLGFSVNDALNLSAVVIGFFTAMLGGGSGLVIENLWKALGFKTISKATTVATVATGVPPSGAAEHLGFTVTPTNLEGKSPFLAVFQIKCSTICIGWRINWTDGSPIQDGSFTSEGEYHVANVYHSYSYSFDGKYTGHTFYPTITIISKDGVVNTFNTETTGRCLSIVVNS